MSSILPVAGKALKLEKGDREGKEHAIHTTFARCLSISKGRKMYKAREDPVYLKYIAKNSTHFWSSIAMPSTLCDNKYAASQILRVQMQSTFQQSKAQHETRE